MPTDWPAITLPPEPPPSDETQPVDDAWLVDPRDGNVYQRMIAAYRDPDRTAARAAMTALIDCLRQGVPAALIELRRLGRTAVEVSVLGFGGNALGNLIINDGVENLGLLVFNEEYGTSLRDVVQATVEGAGGTIKNAVAGMYRRNSRWVRATRSSAKVTVSSADPVTSFSAMSKRISIPSVTTSTTCGTPTSTLASYAPATCSGVSPWLAPTS